MSMLNRERKGGNHTAYVPLLSSSPPLPQAQQQAQQQRGGGRRTSPAPERPDARRIAALGATNPILIGRRGASGAIAPGQPAPAGRQRDKFVPLPDQDDNEEAPLAPVPPSIPPPLYPYQPPPGITPTLFEDIDDRARMPPAAALAEDIGNTRGRITFYCVAEAFDRKKLDELLHLTFPETAIKSFPDVFWVEYHKGSDLQPGADIFFFDWGVVACWGMTKTQEMTVVQGMARQVQTQPLPDDEVEIDEFQYNYTVVEKPHVQNDTVTLHRRFAKDSNMKLGISYALAQSTKLSVYEKRVVDIVLETKNLPEALAETGEVKISSTNIAKLIGKVFLQKSAVNLLSSVLDTPEFFWHQPDSLQLMYNRVIEYLELPTRVELLNSRFSVLQEMLDMLRDHQNNYHNVRLEWIVIWLIVVEVVVGLFELLGLFGLVGRGEKA